MFEAMMERFEEETVRYLYLMQVIEAPSRPVPQHAISAGDFDSNEQAIAAFSTGSRRNRATTSMDDMEEAFQRRKRRELEQARMAGAGEAGTVQQVVRGEKVGRNDPCPCGSGKKYKKCCGA
jgi:preprotein translocase subunit SecA